MVQLQATDRRKIVTIRIEEEIVEEALEDIIDDDDFDSLLEGLEDEL